MKAQCDRCKEIVPLVFTLEPTAIRVQCPSCAANYTVEATESEPVPAPAPVPVPENACPKCGEPSPKDAKACPRCGLIFANWTPTGTAADSALLLGDIRTAQVLFAACEEAWSDPTRHEAFLAHCQLTGALAFAASSYRRQTALPERQSMAKERLSQIRGLAEKTLAIAPRPPDQKTPRSPTTTIALLALVVVLLVCGIFIMTCRMDAHRPSPARTSP